MKVIFAGTPDFVRPVLRALCRCGHDVAGVVTPPDRPAGRGRKLTPPPVKDEAERLNLDVHQTADINSEQSVDWLAARNPDALIVAAFGQFLSKKILALPRFGCLNAHLSLLPKYRGAAPVARAILEGERESGVSIIRLVRKMDAGPILLQRKLQILPDETAGELQDRLGEMGGEVIVEALDLIQSGRAVFTPQDEWLATFAPMLRKEDGLIDWSEPAHRIFNHIRAMNPWPLAYTFYLDGDKGNARLILNRVAVASKKYPPASPGEVIDIAEDGPVVAAGDGAIILKEVKPPGKRAMTGAEYLRGHSLRIGRRFGVFDERK